MGDTVGVSLVLLLLANYVSGACVQVPNNDMLEYSCEDIQMNDIHQIPEHAEKIRISNSNLGRITANTFSKFGNNLWVLSCSFCGISDIEDNAFKNLVNLQQLRLDNNQLNIVKASWFEGLKDLTYLDLNYNDIRSIEDGVFDNLPGLVDFRVSGNKLQCLNTNEISHLADLRRIFITSNPEFKCPNALIRLLDEKNVSFEKDPEWANISEDLVVVPQIRAMTTTTTTTTTQIPIYRERLIYSRPETTSYAPTTNYPTSSTANYRTSASYPSAEMSTQPPRWSYPTSEVPYPTQNWPVPEPKSGDYVSSSSSSSLPYNDPYYPPMVSRTQNPHMLPAPTTTSRISWTGNADETFNETDYPPMITLPPIYLPPRSQETERPDENRNYEYPKTTMKHIDDESYPRPHPLEKYQQVKEAVPIDLFPTTTTTDKPLPDCNNASGTLTISFGIILLMIINSIFRTL